MPKIVFNKLINSGDFAAAARSIRTRGTSLKSDVQKALICGLVHMEAHGDYTSSVIPLLDAIKDAFGKNLHVAAQEWVLAFSWLRYDETEKKLVKDQTKTMKVKDAEAVNWWTTERPAKAVPFDAQKAIDQLFAKLADAIKAEKLTPGAVTAMVGKKLVETDHNAVIAMFNTLDLAGKTEVLASITEVVSAEVEDQKIAA